MLTLTTEDQIKDRLRQGYDSAYYQSQFRQRAYVFGSSLNQESVPDLGRSGAQFPIFPHLHVSEETVGRSRGILNNLFIDTARIRYSEVEPEFPQVGEDLVAEARKQFWLRRARGDQTSPGWTDEFDAAFIEGNAFGIGFVQIGLRDNPRTGLPRVEVVHVPTLNVLWDPHEAHAERMRWVAFCHVMAPEDAIDKYGPMVKRAIRPIASTGNRGESIEVIRVFEYFDNGYGSGRPTRAVVLDDLDGDVILREENPFGCLPVATYVHFYGTGLRRPIGRVWMQMPIQEGINQIEGYIDMAVSLPPRAALDPDLIEDEDWEAIVAGDRVPYVRLKPHQDPSRPAFVAVPGAMVAPETLQRWQMLRDELTSSSGVTDYDRGTFSTTKRTATEAQILTNRSGSQNTWPLRQLSRFMREVIEKVFLIAKKFDQDPVRVDVKGINLTLNDPSEPRLSLQSLCEEESNVLITEEAILATDADRKRDSRLAQLQSLMAVPALQGVIRPQKLAEELLKTLGFEDTSDWLITPTDSPTPMTGSFTEQGEIYGNP